MKKTIKITAVVLILLALAVGSIPFWIDGAARREIEAGVTDALGVPTSVAKVEIGVFSGEARVEGFRVANPTGIEGHFLEIDRGETAVRYRSLLGDRIEVDTVRLDGIRLMLGKVGDDSNYQPILDHMRKSKEESPPSGGASGNGEEDDAKKYVIREIVLRDIDVTARVKVAGVFRPTAHMHIDELRFTNLTDESSGAAMSEVTTLVTQALLTSVVRQGGGILPGEVVEGLGAGLKGVGTLGVSIVDGTGKVLAEGGKLLGNTVGAIFGTRRRKSEEKAKPDGD